MFDDDDYYGPGYINEQIKFLKKENCIIGKTDRFVVLSDSILYLLDNEQQFSYVESVHGPTITFHSEESEYYPENVKWEDDYAYINIMRKKGIKTYSTSIYNFCYSRIGNKHIWPIPDLELIDLCQSFGGNAYKIGQFNENIINNKKGFIKNKMDLVNMDPDESFIFKNML